MMVEAPVLAAAYELYGTGPRSDEFEAAFKRPAFRAVLVSAVRGGKEDLSKNELEMLIEILSHLSMKP